MGGLSGSRDPACGHPVQPGSRFCPVCGRPASGGAAPPHPPSAPSPAVPASPAALPPASSAAAPRPQPESAPWDSWYVPRRPPPPPPGPRPWPAPPGDLPAAILGGLRPAGGPRRSRRRLVPVIVAAALVAIVAALVVARARSGSTAASGAAGIRPPASSQAARQAAVRLSGLLAQSVTDRAAVIDAVADVRGCGPSLGRDARTFARAAGSRKRLLSLLGSLPGRSLLPAAMLQDLAGAWQASAQADTDLAGWAHDEIARGCHRDSRSDAGLRASYVPDGRATAGKRAFVRLWNPVARRYGLTTYQWNQL